MPYNGAGTFTLASPAAPFVTGAVISATDMNTVQQDIATNGLTNAVTRDGQSPLTANWAVGSFNITGISTLGATTLNVSGIATIGTLAVATVSPTTLTVSGNATIGGTLGVTGAITGSSTISGTAITASTGLTVAAGGATVTGNSTITGTLGSLTGLTMASGLITASASGIRFSDASTQTTAATAYAATGTASTTGKLVLPINSAAASIMMQWGQGTTGGAGNVTVTFGTAFASTPRVTVSFTGSSTNNNFANTEDVAAASFKGWVYDSAGNEVASALFDWIAIGVA